MTENWMDGLAAGFTPTEPSADMREAASGLRQLFTALTNEGFTERQAMEITIKAMLGGGRK